MPFELILPKILDERTLESVLEEAGALLEGPRTLILEMGRLESIDLLGAVAVLELGHSLRRKGFRMLLHLPISLAAQHRLARLGFLSPALAVYTVYPGHRKSERPLPETVGTGILLRITPVGTLPELRKAVAPIVGEADPALKSIGTIMGAAGCGGTDPFREGGYAAGERQGGLQLILSARPGAPAPAVRAESRAFVAETGGSLTIRSGTVRYSDGPGIPRGGRWEDGLPAFPASIFRFTIPSPEGGRFPCPPPVFT